MKNHLHEQLRKAKAKKTVMVRGFTYFVKMLAPMLQDTDLFFLDTGYKMFPSVIWNLIRCNALYYIGGNPRGSPIARAALFLGKPVVVHWAGNDIIHAIHAVKDGNINFKCINACINWCEVEWTAKELAEIGIKTEVVPLTTTLFPSTAPPMPREFKILSYLGIDPEFYGLGHLLNLAADFPNVLIQVVGNSGLRQSELPGNVRLLGRVEDMGKIYAESSVYIRMTVHDGLAFMILESLAHGRHAIWTQPFQGVLLARDYPSLRSHVERLILLHNKGELQINLEGLNFVRAEYHPHKIFTNLQERFRRIAAQRKAQ